jgi:hypothetical protein
MAQTRRNPATWLPLLSIVVLAAPWVAQGCASDDRDFAGAATGGEGGLGGSGGSGGTLASGGGGGGAGDANPGSGGTSPQEITCAGTSYPAPEVSGDWACETFDGTWPPAAPWTLSGPAGALEIVDDLFVSSPNSLQVNVPSSGSPDAKLSWSNTAGSDITEVRLELEVMHNPLPAAPPPWDEPLAIACVDFGQTEGCLLYQWGNGGYSLRITNYQTIPQSDDCDISGTLTSGSWSHVTLTLDDAGDLTFRMEGEDPVVCSRGSAVVGTVASVWVGMAGDSADRQGYYPRIDNVFALVTRE